MLAHIEGKEPEISLIRGYRSSEDSHYRNLTSYYIDTASLFFPLSHFLSLFLSVPLSPL